MYLLLFTVVKASCELVYSYRESNGDVLGHQDSVRCLRADGHVVVDVSDRHIDSHGRRTGRTATVHGDHLERDGIGGESFKVDWLLNFNQTRG